MDSDISLWATVRSLTVRRVSSRISTYEAWHRLLDGNERFVSGDSLHPNQNASRRSELVNTQNPFAVIFGCADSRLAAEIIFDVGLGDVFVVRTAGHVIDDAILRSKDDFIGPPAGPSEGRAPEGIRGTAVASAKGTGGARLAREAVGRHRHGALRPGLLTPLTLDICISGTT